ncbi:hypothetical protein [Elioraea sp.]|uniref:hypothetical protein n=1 Tax=Elioraea sp. TaxID=2185103 RepID=UPI0026322EF3|nr:hypothetical protein [Elioraea sp.]
MPIFDVSASDIADLDDAALRRLVAELCRAELAAAGLPTSAVTDGGDQRAPDDGVDVRVDVAGTPEDLDFIPHGTSLFQVKQQMTFRDRDIRTEMSPGGVLRPAIARLGGSGGAYVIVSGRESLPPERVEARQATMRALVPVGVKVAFYDGTAVARWTSKHPAVMLWVRQQLGRGLNGWEPYGNWSAPGQPDDERYIIDEQTPRVSLGLGRGREAVSVPVGIMRMRERLSQPSGIVRLVGLSGTGKTRLAQALFDDSIGDGALPKVEALYTDMARGPQPAPQEVIAQLSSQQRSAVLVIDNCLAATHRILADEVRRRCGRCRRGCGGKWGGVVSGLFRKP